METGLKDKVAIVTGGSKGIGKAIAIALAEEGCRLAICARGESGLAETAKALEATGAEVLSEPVDMSKSGDIARFVTKVIERFGTAHILVNNAGSVGSFAAFDELSDEEWQDILNLNLFGVVKITRALLPYMRQQKWGRIINISSESGIQPDPVMPHYNASKAALINLTKSLSKAYGAEGVLVNTVSPAFVLTPLVDEVLGGEAEKRGISLEELLPLFLAEARPHIEVKRPGRPEEVASAVVYLASEAASYITGVNLRVDGGSVASI